MKPFFVFTHIGTNVDMWNEFISSHKRIQSSFEYGKQRVYLNSNLEENAPIRSKWFFSKAKWYDILLHNHQVGYKNFYKEYPVIIIFGSRKQSISNIKSSKIIDPKFSENYFDLRVQRLKYICNHSSNPLVFIEGLSDPCKMKRDIAELLNIQECEFEPTDFLNSGPFDQELFDYLKELELEKKIKLSI